MKLPRNIDSAMLVARLGRLGYARVRQRGSHMTLRTEEHGGHSLWIPAKDPLAVGTLRSILGQAAEHAGISVAELLELLGLD